LKSVTAHASSYSNAIGQSQKRSFNCQTTTSVLFFLLLLPRGILALAAIAVALGIATAVVNSSFTPPFSHHLQARLVMIGHL